MKQRRRAFGWIALSSVMVVGCFDENVLHPPTDGAVTDVTNDLGKVDAGGGMDAGFVDVQTVDVVDAGSRPDASDGGDGGDVVVGPSGPACDMAPLTATSNAVLNDLSGVLDFAFDGRGGVAFSQGSSVLLRRDRDTLPVTTVPSGEVVALRYTRTHGLVLAAAVRTEAGMGTGAIYQLAPGDTTPTVRYSSLVSPGGLAIGPDDSIWFSDTGTNTIYRLPPDVDAGTAPQTVVTDVMAPTQLLLDVNGRYLFVAQSAANKVVRIDLMAGDGGALGGATDFVVGLARISGLAQDECGNVFVADNVLGRIFRAPLDASLAVVRLIDVASPRTLMFGVGAPYGPRELYTLSTTEGSLRAANVIARGVPLPVPAP